MKTEEFKLLLTDILEEYRILQDSPLQQIKFVTCRKDVEGLVPHPSITVSFADGSEFQILIIQNS